MRKPLFVRSLTSDERLALKAGLRSPHSLLVRRCPIILASRRGPPARLLAEPLGGDDHTGRHALRAFTPPGLAGVEPGARAPRPTPQAGCEAPRRDQ
jgi:hypothetical protein